MDRLLAELQRPVHAKLLESISEAYKTSGDDLELFGSTSLHTLESLPGYKELLKQQLCAAGVSVRPHSSCKGSASLYVPSLTLCHSSKRSVVDTGVCI